MNHFIKSLVIMFFLFSIQVQAHASSASTTVDLTELTEAQRLQIMQKTLELKTENQNTVSAPAVQKVAEWASLSQQFGMALAQTAKELGITANQFVETPVGKMVAAIIIWKLIGGALVHIAGGAIFFLIASLIWLYLFRRLCLIASVKEVPGSRWFGLVHNKEYTYYDSDAVNSERTVLTCFAVAIAVVSIFIIFSY
jgi:hypothetical protein